jgi:xanthine dehydrogenase large subunit
LKNTDSIKHTRGESYFIDDLAAPEGTLFGYVFYSTVAHGKITKLDFTEALASKGVAGIIKASDIPGENQIGGVIKDEDLFAEDTVHFIGHPIALVVADTFLNAHEGARKIKCEYEKLPAIFAPREAAAKNELIIPPRTFAMGDVDYAWKDCDLIVEGSVESGGQEHLYLETQGALSVPTEGGGVKIFSSTQGPTAVQRTASAVLGLPMNKIEVDTPRLGGGFGGKEDQATPWAVMSALAAWKLNRAVKLILPRQEDIRITGKRHPYSSDYKIGFDKEGKILAYEVAFYQNAGAATDLSTAILDRTLFHTTNTYFVPNVKATAYCCRTNLAPFTAFRGFGGPQGMFVIESALYKAAQIMDVSPVYLQKVNLLQEGDEFLYGQKTLNCNAKRCFDELEDKQDILEAFRKVDEFNSKNKLIKKGAAVMPICFGISFTTTFLNQASALIHIYTDGSINVSTAAVEMGQGVNSKMRIVAAGKLGVNIDRIKIETTNTGRVANTSATAASKGADLNGFAVINACKILTERLKLVAAEKLLVDSPEGIEIKNDMVFYEGKETSLSFDEIIQAAYVKRISLTAQAFHASENVSFDPKTCKGNPFAYHSYGTALVQVTLDCLRGTYEIDSIDVVHDFGKSIDQAIDLGQAEGAIAQGIGWMTFEELIWNKDGKLITDALSTYKVPDIHSAAKRIKIDSLTDAPNPFGPLNSKAIGEPPFMYGIGAFFALMNAIRAFKPDVKINYSAPLTPEKVLLTLYNNF